MLLGDTGLKEGHDAPGCEDFTAHTDRVEDDEGRVAEEQQGKWHELQQAKAASSCSQSRTRMRPDLCIDRVEAVKDVTNDLGEAPAHLVSDPNIESRTEIVGRPGHNRHNPNSVVVIDGKRLGRHLSHKQTEIRFVKN